MGFFYFDESVQEKGRFIIGAFAYSRKDLTPAIFGALAQAGLRPGQDEFKSGAWMAAHPEQVNARESLVELLQTVRIGVVIVPASDRPRLGAEAIGGLAKILQANSLTDVPHKIFFDDGIVVDGSSLDTFRDGVGALCEIHVDQNSRTVGGIQLADLAAHSMGIMLLEHQSLIKKMVKTGENSGFDPSMEIELGSVLYGRLRHAFFHAPQPIRGPISDDPIFEAMFDVENYGLHVAAICDDALRDAAIAAFGVCYVGCMH